MPAVPLAETHHVVVELLVQIVQQRYRLDDHRVHLVHRELEFVAGESVRESQGHCLEVRFRETVNQVCDLESGKLEIYLNFEIPEASEEFFH